MALLQYLSFDPQRLGALGLGKLGSLKGGLPMGKICRAISKKLGITAYESGFGVRVYCQGLGVRARDDCQGFGSAAKRSGERPQSAACCDVRPWVPVENATPLSGAQRK